MIMDYVLYIRILMVLIVLAMVGCYFAYRHDSAEAAQRRNERMGWSPFPPPWNADG